MQLFLCVFSTPLRLGVKERELPNEHSGERAGKKRVYSKSITQKFDFSEKSNFVAPLH
jgi:hypothetical protein